MSLTNCLKKAGDSINKKDRAAILARSRELRGQGIKPDAAAVQAVGELIAKLQAQVDTHPARMSRQAGQGDADPGAAPKAPADTATEPSVETLRAALVQRFGPVIAQMEARGVLKLWSSTQDYNDGQTSEPIDGPAQGYWDGKVAHLFAASIEPGLEVAVLLHEVGEHASMRAMLGKEAYARLVERAYGLVDAGNETAMRAVDRIPDDTPDQYKDSEFLAYLIETVAADGAKAEPSAKKWLDDVIAAVRAWWSQTGLNKLLDRYGKGIELSPADIAALAIRAVKWQAGQGQQGQVGERGTKRSMATNDVVGNDQGGRSADDSTLALTPEQKAQALDETRWLDRGLKIGAGQKLYRGTSERSGRGTAEYGKGLYVTTDRAQAEQFGNVVEMSRSDLPSNPLRFRDEATFRAWESFVRREVLGIRSNQEFEQKHGIPDQWIRNLLDPSIDGVQLGTGHGAFFVKFSPNESPAPDSDGAPGQLSRPAGQPSQAARAAANVFGTSDATRKRTAGADKTQAKGEPVNPNGLESAVQSWDVPEVSAWDNVVRIMQDNKVDLKRVRDSIEERYGRLDDAVDAYLKEELYQGRVAERIKLLHKESINPILAKLAVAAKNNKVTLDDLNQFLHARHAPEANAKLKEINPSTPDNDALSGMSDAQASKAMADLRAAGKLTALERIAKDVDQLLRDTRTNLVVDGLESETTIKAWEKAYKHYVPLQRDLTSSPAKGQGISVRGPESKRRTGSNREVVNILANIVAQAETAAIRAEKVEVGRSLLAMAEEFPNPKFWTIDKPPVRPRINPKTGLVERSAIDPNYQSADNVVVVKSYGGERFIVFNTDNPRAMEMAKAMKNLDIQQMPKAFQWLATVTRLMASLLTQRSPEFWFTNFARDIQAAGIQMNGTDAEGLQAAALDNLPAAMAGMRHVSRETGKDTAWSRHAQDLKTAGGTTGYMQMFDNSDARMKSLQTEVDRMGQGKADPRRLAREMLKFVDDYNDVIENGIRLAVFQAARDHGVTTERAASVAKNVTVNFNRKGNASTFINSAYMFFNAGVQGSARLAQALATSKKARIIVGTMAAAAFAMDMFNRAMAGDDDETKRNRYDALDDFTKSRNWIFMYPDKSGRHIKIPISLGWNIFPNVGRLASEAINRKDGEKETMDYAWELVTSVIGAFNPLGNFVSPGQFAAFSVAKPVVQVWDNENFMGGPVYRSRDLGFGKTDPRPAYTRHFENTPAIWKQASEMLNDATGGDNVKRGKINIEPDILRHIFTSITGGPGRSLDRMLDTAQASAGGEAVSPARLPLVSRFYGEFDDKTRDRMFYEAQRRVSLADEDVAYYRKEGRMDLVKEVLQDLGDGDEQRGRKLISEFKSGRKSAKEINASIRRLQRDEVPDSDQAQKFAELRRRRSDLFSRTLSRTDDSGDDEE